MVKLLKFKIVPVLVGAVLALSPLALSVSAAVWEGSATLNAYYWGLNANVRYISENLVEKLPFTGTSDYSGIPVVYGNQVVNGIGLKIDPSVQFLDDVDVYISGYAWTAKAAGDTVSVIGNPFNAENYEATYFSGSTGTTGEVLGSLKYVESFAPQPVDSDVQAAPSGITMRVQYAGGEEYPISQLVIKPVVKCGYSFAGGLANYYTNWRYTSVRVITARTSAELDELSNVADQIIAGNQILEAMKGDVVALLQQIYTQTGDIEIALNQTQTLVNNLLGVSQDILGEAQDANSNLVDIYELLSASFNTIIRNQENVYDLLENTLAEIRNHLHAIRDALIEGDGAVSEDVSEMWGETDSTIGGLNELQKPDFSGEDLEVDGYSPDGNVDYLGNVLSPIFSNSLFFSMLMVSMTFCLVAYVLYGKR